MSLASMLKKERLLTIAMAAGAVGAVIFSSFYAFAKQAETVPDRIFRLHILANSDSEEDQELKYRLRDYLLEDFTGIFQGCQSAEEAREAAESSKVMIAEKSREFLDSNNCSLPVTVSVENTYFTTRSYGNVTVPAGYYDALRVVIGSGEGKNWWCVMFPPLCLPAASDSAEVSYSGWNPIWAKEYRMARLTPEESKEIEDGKGVTFKFAVFEWLERLVNG